MLIVWLALDMVFNATASVLVKTSTKSASLITAIFSPSFIVAVVCFGLGLLAYQRVLTKLPLSTAYPLMISGTVILVTTVGSWALREPVPPIRIVGAAIIVIGVWVIMAP